MKFALIVELPQLSFINATVTEPGPPLDGGVFQFGLHVF